MDSLYWRQFMLSAGMVLLTMVLLGVSFYTLSYNYTVEEKRSEMRDRANLISQLSVTRRIHRRTRCGRWRAWRPA